MHIYESFARVYDTFMDDVPYGEWADHLTGMLRADGIRSGLILDLGCGTGKLTRLLAQAGYDMIGADGSEQMLQAAQEEEINNPLGILYLLQDMRSFELYGTVRAILSTCDSLNYLLQEEELFETFRLVNNYLDPGGLFLFDMNTPYHYEVLCGDNTFAENRAHASFIWENAYDPDTCVNEYDLTLFVEQEKGRFVRSFERHRERAWSLDKIRELLERAELEFLGAWDGYCDRPLLPDSPRMLVAAREKTKKVH